jgi:hypothetical protein
LFFAYRLLFSTVLSSRFAPARALHFFFFLLLSGLRLGWFLHTAIARTSLAASSNCASRLGVAWPNLPWPSSKVNEERKLRFHPDILELFSIQDEDGFAKIGADTIETTQPRSG